MVNLASPVGVVNLASPVGVVNLASPVGVVNLVQPVGVDLAPLVEVMKLVWVAHRQRHGEFETGDETETASWRLNQTR